LDEITFIKERGVSNLATSMMADINVYVRKLGWWQKVRWAMPLSPCKWWVYGYERGWNAALQLVESSKPDVQQPHAVKGETPTLPKR
jgi:hypothetical protein